MTSIQLAEFALWKSIKQKWKDGYANQQSESPNNEQIVFPNEMICRVCTSPGDVPITEKIDGISISSAIRTVSYVLVSSTDACPQFICKNCLGELKVALTFKKKCEASDTLFRQTQTKKPDNIAPSMVKHDFARIIDQMKNRRILSLSQSVTKVRPSGSKRHKIELWDDDDTDGEKPMKVIKCQRCCLTFDSRHSLKEHRIQQNCICPPCSICGKIVGNLERHHKIVHLRTEKYTCHVCGKISHSAGAARNHLLVHTDKCEFACSICPYKGKAQSYLKLHMRIHTGERPYLCSQCPAKFVNPSNLRKHQLIHSSKKFECTKCKKQFRMMKSLKEHYDAAHLNVRYRCSICGRDLWTRRKLLSHELRVHNREKHKLYNEVYKVVLNDDND